MKFWVSTSYDAPYATEDADNIKSRLDDCPILLEAFAVFCATAAPGDMFSADLQWGLDIVCLSGKETEVKRPKPEPKTEPKTVEQTEEEEAAAIDRLVEKNREALRLQGITT